MSQEEFKKQFDIASSLVAQWPIWKRNILEDSSKPTVAIPRLPVDNLRASDQSQKPAKQDD